MIRNAGTMMAARGSENVAADEQPCDGDAGLPSARRGISRRPRNHSPASRNAGAEQQPANAHPPAASRPPDDGTGSRGTSPAPGFER